MKSRKQLSAKTSKRQPPRPQESPDAEKSEGEYRILQLREVESALEKVKSSLETLTGLAQAQTKAVETQWAIVHAMRQVAEKDHERDVCLSRYAGMFT